MKLLKLSLPQGSREKALSSAFQDHGAKVVEDADRGFIHISVLPVACKSGRGPAQS